MAYFIWRVDLTKCHIKVQTRCYSATFKMSRRVVVSRPLTYNGVIKKITQGRGMPGCDLKNGDLLEIFTPQRFQKDGMVRPSYSNKFSRLNKISIDFRAFP